MAHRLLYFHFRTDLADCDVDVHCRSGGCNFAGNILWQQRQLNSHITTCCRYSSDRIHLHLHLIFRVVLGPPGLACTLVRPRPCVLNSVTKVLYQYSGRFDSFDHFFEVCRACKSPALTICAKKIEESSVLFALEHYDQFCDKRTISDTIGALKFRSF